MTDKTYFHSIKLAVILFLIVLISPHSFSAADSTQIDLSYRDYMKIVLSRNIEYLAEKYNVDIAEAEVEKAKIMPDPVFDLERYGSYESNEASQYSLTAEISRTFELGGVRRSRINLAKTGSEIAHTALDDYVRSLVSDASEEYLAAMKHVYMYRVMVSSYQMMKDLADADSVRLSLGSIKYIDAAQSRIEAGVLFNELLNADAERKTSLINLSSMMGSSYTDTVYFPTGKFERYIRHYNLDTLLNTALLKRADLQLAKTNISYYRNFLELTKSERATDIDLRIGAGEAYVENKVFSPYAHDFHAGISIPLKFSNLNKGELKIAKYQVQQGELAYRQVEMLVRNEVVSAFQNYIAVCRQVETYDNGLLEKSAEVLQGKIYSYSRGETSLLEVLNAQRTYNDLQISYIETVYNCFVALVGLEKAAGTCNIDL